MDWRIVVAPSSSDARWRANGRYPNWERIVVGPAWRARVPEETQARQRPLEFMSIARLQRKNPKGATVREIAAAMRTLKAAGEKSWRAGTSRPSTPAQRMGPQVDPAWLPECLFAGNALATHDMEQASTAPSLGVSLERGLPAHGGTNSLAHINTIRVWWHRGGRTAKGKLTSGANHVRVREGLMCVVLAGSIRDDGPLRNCNRCATGPGAMSEARARRRASALHGGKRRLHSIASRNLLPAWVKVACVDINPCHREQSS